MDNKPHHNLESFIFLFAIVLLALNGGIYKQAAENQYYGTVLATWLSPFYNLACIPIGRLRLRKVKRTHPGADLKWYYRIVNFLPLATGALFFYLLSQIRVHGC